MADDHSNRDSTKPLSRRAFIQSACLTGVTLIGLEALRPALAAGDPQTSRTGDAPALAFWDGRRLVDASRHVAGDPSLVAAGVRVSVEAHSGAVRTLYGLSTLYRIDAGGVNFEVPFHAWTASPHSSKRVTFTMPAGSGQELRLNVDHADHSGGRLSSAVRLKLRAGTYVLAAPGTRLGGFRLEETDGTPRLVRAGDASPADFDHL